MTTTLNDSYHLQINAQETSAIDPWLPRIQNNDEYLQLGLTFAPPNTENDDENNNKFRPLGDVGAIRLANALQSNTHLQSLNLSGNDIKGEGCAALARALYRSTSPSVGESRTALRVLNLSRNAIRDEGAIALVEALKYNTLLEKLDLSYNEISLKGVVELISCLDVSGIRELNLVGNLNKLSARDLTILIEKLSVCSSSRLEVLEIQSERNNEVDERQIDGCLGGISDEDAWTVLQTMYGVSSAHHTTEPYCLSTKSKLQSHRLRKLTLPESIDGKSNDSNRQRLQLARVLHFNSFYHPILELHDIVNIQSSISINAKTELPNHLQRDIHSGALIGLLPPPLVNGRIRGDATGISYKEIPHVIAFAAKECRLDTLWNVLRYRPDVFRYSGYSFRGHEIGAGCGACVII